MLEAFRTHLAEQFPELAEHPFLLACSGGLDSMVLAHLCAAAGLRFDLAHCNFNLRGGESDADQKLVEETAISLNKEFYVKSFDTIGYVNQHKVSVQMAARTLRYDWFHQLARDSSLHFIVTAHHADDALETFLINLGRGSGLEGLCGIPSRHGIIRRPMLIFGREELEAYAAKRDIPWREDASNADTRYLRNLVRKEVVPALKSTSPGFLDQFGHSLQHLRESRALVGRYMEGIFHKVCRERDGILVYSVPALRRLHPLDAHLYELFRDYGFTDWKAIGRLMHSETGREVRSHTHRLLRNREELLLKPVEGEESAEYVIDLDNVPENLPVRLLVKEVEAMEEVSGRILYIDKETLNKQLLLRKWRKGDYFYPMGLGGRKKVSKFFKDEGWSQFQKEAAWLLCSGDDVVWVVGHRADNRFRVRDTTRKILKIKWLED